jgi:DNA primase
MLAELGSRVGLIPHPAAETSKRILLVEGPPDMIAARSRGLPAIAVPGDHAWQPAWAHLLAGRRVTIVMDSDTAGRAAATRIGEGLRRVADAHIVDPAPGRSDGYDLTDWLLEHATLTREDLHAQLVAVHTANPPQAGRLR